MADADIGIGAPLVDAEEHLARVHAAGQGVQPLVLGHAALQPAGGAGAGLLHVLPGGWILDALVKGHGHVAAQVGLDLHGLLRAHKNAPPVDVRGEGHALLLDLLQTGQGEHLKAAAVGEHGAVPPHELVQAAHVPHHPVAGAQMQVIGVGQLDLTAQLFQVKGVYRAFNSPLGAHVHKHRGLGRAVGAGKHPPPGLPLRF